MTKVFIDGSEGTTGLRINERFMDREDIEILKIDPELRKDTAERKKMINQSDITFLCLPDAAAREAVELVENDNVRIIDSSTAHRTSQGWAYGFPELSPAHRAAIETGKRVAVPGCHASGFISLAYPLVSGGILPADYPISAMSLSGYSGAGKKAIAKYNDPDRDKTLSSPREYATAQMHKHLPEMKIISGLSREPLFMPVIADYYSGMVVSIPVQAEYLKKKTTPQELQEYFAEYYKDSTFIKVMPFGAEAEEYDGMLAGNAQSGWDGMRIFVTGNENRILFTSQFDNLGKGASGAAIECMNIMIGAPETKGLVL